MKKFYEIIFVLLLSSLLGCEDYQKIYKDEYSEEEWFAVEEEGDNNVFSSSEQNKSSSSGEKGVSSSSVVISENGFEYGVLEDSRDGKKYKTIQIGNQIWMAENLNYASEYSSCYKDSASYCRKYGRLYSKNEAVSICPQDWHLPSKEEWMELFEYAGGTDSAGKKLKSRKEWDGYDSYGFNALPAGRASPSYYDAGKSTSFWSSSPTSFYYYYLRLNDGNSVSVNFEGNGYYFSVRCLKDPEYFCGDRRYYPEEEFCASDTTVQKLCGGEEFDYLNYVCESGKIKPLCGSKPYDASSSFCGSDTLVHDLCGGKTYDVSTKFCQDSKTHDLCGGESYDVRSYSCSENRIMKLCGKVVYDTLEYFCAADTTVHPVAAVEYGSLTDVRDGKTYRTIAIGSQVWMAENLNYASEYSRCYKDSSSYCKKYGRLYSKNEAISICPQDWHLPSKEEWMELFEYAGGMDSAGKKLKSWKEWDGYDSYGFNALPAGRGVSSYYDVGENTSFWSSSPTSFYYYYYRLNDGNSVNVNFEGNGYYFSVRCLKDSEYFCGERRYYPEEEFCASDTTVHKLCGGAEFDYLNYACESGKIKPLCGSVPYEVSSSFCGSDMQVHDLCGGETYEVSTSFCGTDMQIHGLCSGKTYDVGFYVCSEGQVMGLCGNVVYDTLNYVCDADSTIHLVDAFEYGSLTDARDGKTYHTIAIGSQVWMVENLSYATSDSYCYDGKTSNCTKYGRLYDHSAAKKVCPSGWHLPEKAEWESLFQAVGGESVAGKKLKAKRGWYDGGNGMNSFGFLALPGGSKANMANNGTYSGVEKMGEFWTATSFSDPYYAYHVTMSYDKDNAAIDRESVYYRFSVRCVKSSS